MVDMIVEAMFNPNVLFPFWIAIGLIIAVPNLIREYKEEKENKED